VGHWEGADVPPAGAIDFQADGVAVVALGAQKLIGPYTVNGDGSVDVKAGLPGGVVFPLKFAKVQATKGELTLTDQNGRTMHFKRSAGDAPKPPDKPKDDPAPPGPAWGRAGERRRPRLTAGPGGRRPPPLCLPPAPAAR
jgi:hypothetical protein